MTNAVYSMVVRALSGVVSVRAAETMLRASMRDQNLHPDQITAGEMQQVLSGPLLERLSLAMPAGRAREELGRLSRQIAAEYPKAPTLFLEGEPLAAWDDSPEIGKDGDTVEFTADDFEFDDPEYIGASVAREYDLANTAEQDALIQDLGRLTGVHGVMICRANGEVLRLRALQDASALSAVVAATAMLFQQRSLKLMSADLGSQTICMRPLGGYCVAVVARANVNVGRLLAELQQVQVAV